MKKIFTNIITWFTPRTWVRTRYERNGLLLQNKIVNGKPLLRLRIVKRNGEGTIDKDVPYGDVMMISKYPSPFAKKFLFRCPKNYRVCVSPAGGGKGVDKPATRNPKPATA